MLLNSFWAKSLCWAGIWNTSTEYWFHSDSAPHRRNVGSRKADPPPRSQVHGLVESRLFHQWYLYPVPTRGLQFSLQRDNEWLCTMSDEWASTRFILCFMFIHGDRRPPIALDPTLLKLSLRVVCTYWELLTAVKSCCNKYYDISDISDFDISDFRKELFWTNLELLCRQVAIRYYCLSLHFITRPNQGRTQIKVAPIGEHYMIFFSECWQDNNYSNNDGAKSVHPSIKKLKHLAPTSLWGLRNRWYWLCP